MAEAGRGRRMPSVSSLDACRRAFNLSGRNPSAEDVEQCALILEGVGTSYTYAEAVEKLKELGMDGDQAHRVVKIAARRL